MLRNLVRCVIAFLARTDGNVALLFVPASVGLLAAVGGGIELSRAYDASQKLNQVADLACQYASRPSQVQLATSAPTTYSTNVKAYIATSLTSQKFGFTQTNATPFTYTKNGAADVSLASSVPTIFAGLVHVTTIPLTATAHCYDAPSSIPQRVPNNNSNLITQEGFENTSICSSSGFCYVSANGTVGTNGGTTGTTSTPSSAASTTPSYTGSGGAVWYVTGYCVEIDHAGAIKSTVPEGFYSAELDCDNGSGSAGNSSISTNVYLPTGSYELRYNYVSRVDYPNYDPAYICGSTSDDVNWATDTNSSGGPVSGASRTNQINVYLDANTGPVPTHQTIDLKQNLAGKNLIDVCVYSQNWIERSVRINVTTAGYYWLSFAADGQNDSYGGQIDDIRLCNGSCTDSFQGGFPSAWVPTTPLFEDTFESPAYANNNNTNYNTSGNLNSSTGTSGTSTSGWPKQAASGWATAPNNQVDYVLTAAAQGSQSIMLDAGTSSPTNRLTSRPFLLDPGYYRVDYNYISNLMFSSGGNTTYCASNPNAAAVAAATRSGSGTASVRFYPSYTLNNINYDTNIVGVFMSHAQLASTPVGGGALNSQTSYNNPDGTTSTNPSPSPAAVSLTNYNVNQPNPLIDICTYAGTWQPRSATIQITKPAYYWLTFASLGTNEGAGGGIDDVRLTALGGPTSTAPSTFTTIPVPAPQPGGTYTNNGAFTGFSIIADPFAASGS